MKIKKTLLSKLAEAYASTKPDVYSECMAHIILASCVAISPLILSRIGFPDANWDMILARS